MLAAQQYYIENGHKMDPDHLHKVVRNYIPDHFLQAGEKALPVWEKKISDAFRISICVKERFLPLKAQEQIVTYGKISWPILFSKFFEAMKIDGPELSSNNLIIAVNWTGIYIVDNHEQILLELTFAEITYVGYRKNSHSMLHDFTIKTVEKEEYVFQCPDAEELNNLIMYLLDGLKKRTQYVIVTQEYKNPAVTSYLELKRGDLIHLLNGETGQDLMTAMWGYGECNGKQGNFPTENVYILPVLAPPPKQIQALFAKDAAADATKKTVKQSVPTIQRIKFYTLAKYAEENFRQARRYTVARGTAIQSRRSSREELWRHTSEPIQAPLLQKLQQDEQLSKEACLSFMAILKYMGDLPAVKPKHSNEHTNQIFGVALKNDGLKDEVYCQIMRQLTNNRLLQSEDCGWELLWLATGIFAPSPGLMKELNEFLKTRIHPLAKICLQRVQKTQKCGQRMFPPYTIEVEAIKHKSLQIYHKVYFPDDTDEAFEVDSLTTAKDLCEDITQRLELKTTDGFSLFVMIADKIFSIPDDYYFFDFIHELIEWMHKTNPNWNGKNIFLKYTILSTIIYSKYKIRINR